MTTTTATTPVIRYTTTPIDYDGFGTVSLGTVGTLDRRPVRKVAIQPSALAWQESRYNSGPFCCLPEEMYLDWVKAGIVTS